MKLVGYGFRLRQTEQTATLKPIKPILDDHNTRKLVRCKATLPNLHVEQTNAEPKTTDCDGGCQHKMSGFNQQHKLQGEREILYEDIMVNLFGKKFAGFMAT